MKNSFPVLAVALLPILAQFSVQNVAVAAVPTHFNALSGAATVVTGFAHGTRATQSPTGSFDQVIDHFATSASPTFKQRYFVDSSLATDANSPVIYYLCGEGTCEGSVGTDEVDALAARIHAHRVALEHRYYGYSVPNNSLANDNLKYLSMDQAIEDLATFEQYAQNTLGLKGKWISVGGSYSGALSAFYRLKHPELVVGALASSAPVLAKADFYEYDQYVAKVAGPVCLKAIQTVVADVESKLKSPASAKQVKALFSASAVVNNVDFLYVLADMAATAIQYGFQDQFCGALATGMQSGNATAAYAKVGVELFQNFGLTPLQDSFQGAESTDPADYLGWVGDRSWMYQSCTEFGFYQIASPNPATSARSAQITLQYHNETCNRLFGITTPVNTDATNQKYYDQLLHGGITNIFMTNGGNDPWSQLSILAGEASAEVNPGLQFFTIAGSAHCDDLGSRMSDALTQARAEFNTLVDQWLK
jgi:pimeloyl-ACP methyl ester carboxylesterase